MGRLRAPADRLSDPAHQWLFARLDEVASTIQAEGS
jgi:hypothetical protein